MKSENSIQGFFFWFICLCFAGTIIEAGFPQQKERPGQAPFLELYSASQHQATEALNYVSEHLCFISIYFCIHLQNISCSISKTSIPVSKNYRIFQTIRHTSPKKIWEENGGASYSLNVAYLVHWCLGRRRWSGVTGGRIRTTFFASNFFAFFSSSKT